MKDERLKEWDRAMDAYLLGPDADAIESLRRLEEMTAKLRAEGVLQPAVNFKRAA